MRVTRRRSLAVPLLPAPVVLHLDLVDLDAGGLAARRLHQRAILILVTNAVDDCSGNGESAPVGAAPRGVLGGLRPVRTGDELQQLPEPGHHPEAAAGHQRHRGELGLRTADLVLIYLGSLYRFFGSVAPPGTTSALLRLKWIHLNMPS